MHIIQYHPSVIPPLGYGGIERIVFWLTRELVSLGHQVSLMSSGKSTIQKILPEVNLIPIEREHPDYRELIPEEADIIHFHETPQQGRLPDMPYLITIHGNGSPGEIFLPNTVFLSKAHADNHNAPINVYNGVPEQDPDYEKENYILFMAKLSWRVKNAKTAINLSLDTGLHLKLGGGKIWATPKIWGKWIFRRGKNLLQNQGFVFGERKKELIKKAGILFYIVNWQDPCPVAPLEALAYGTPVLGSPNGALPEFIANGKNGFIVNDYNEAVRVLRTYQQMSKDEKLEIYKNAYQSVKTSRSMTHEYLKLYEIIKKEKYLYHPELAGKIGFSPRKTIIISKT
jgi:glycosyltransferase involved in cell wall biosynthesis